jgi:hypothetical protein
METSTSATGQTMVNNLVLDKKMQDYRNSKELQYFWDVLSDCISDARIDKELGDNAGKYYGNRIAARNALIRRDLEEAKLFASTRDAYAKVTCEKILQFFRTSIFSWSTGGKNYANGGDIEAFKHMPVAHLEELYNHENITEMENLSELIDDVVVKIIEEFKSFEAVRSCFIFYSHRPAFAKNPPIFRDCLEYIVQISRHAREAGANESYFQNAGAHIRQYRDMLDPEKNIGEDYKLFLSSSDKSTSQICHDIEETLSQYLQTLITFTQMQKKEKKEDIKLDLTSFLSDTGYTLETLHKEIVPTYKNGMDKVMFKRSGWELHTIPQSKK